MPEVDSERVPEFSMREFTFSGTFMAAVLLDIGCGSFLGIRAEH